MQVGITPDPQRLRVAPPVSPLEGAPVLPTVAALTRAAQGTGLVLEPDIKLVVVQHMVRTNLTLFQALLRLGLKPENVCAIGKGYSTSLDCVSALRAAGIWVFPDLVPPAPGKYEETREQELGAFWEQAQGSASLQANQKLIICDVGGRLLSRIGHERSQSGSGHRSVGVELTTSGIRRLETRALGIPVINVAESAAKSLHESPLVAEAILDRLDLQSPGRWPHLRAGVIGVGNIGQAMIAALRRRGVEVLVSTACGQNDHFRSWSCVPVPELVERAEIIFGCSGVDVFSGGFPPSHNPDLILVSCSSEDVEFRSLLTQSAACSSGAWPVPDVTISGPSGPITILRGGFPFNFDDSGVSLPEEMVQTTTALMLSAILTASHMLSREPEESRRGFIQLPGYLQSAVLNHWRQSSAASGDVRQALEAAVGAEHLGAKSKGEPLPNQEIFERTAALMGVVPLR